MAMLLGGVRKRRSSLSSTLTTWKFTRGTPPEHLSGIPRAKPLTSGVTGRFVPRRGRVGHAQTLHSGLVRGEACLALPPRAARGEGRNHAVAVLACALSRWRPAHSVSVDNRRRLVPDPPRISVRAPTWPRSAPPGPE